MSQDSAEPMRVMLVSESAEQLQVMHSLFEDYGHLSTQLLAEQLTEEAVNQQHGADLWVVEIGDESRAVEAMELLMEAVERPVMFGEGFLPANDRDAWRRRMLEKLEALNDRGQIHWLGVPASRAPAVVAPPPAPASSDAAPDAATAPAPDPVPLLPALKALKRRAREPQTVWLLAASTGGPNAVKTFLDAVPADLPVAFVYAQHINSGFEKLLVRVLGKDNDFRFSLCDGWSRLQHGQVAIVPVDRQVQFADNGMMSLRSQAWDGFFSPSIDAVMQNLAAVYGESLGVIVFTGMGDDGKAACAAVQTAGGRVWAQDAATSTITSMPDGARATGVVEYSGNPTELAQALVSLCVAD